MAENNNDSNTSNRGFAGMSKSKQREIARKGGKASHSGQSSSSRSSGSGSNLSEEARRRGGENSHKNS